MPDAKQPNIIFIMSDDHAAHAMSCYGSRINETPNLDRIAAGGMRLDNCFCTNSICTPSRATILAGTYNHINNVTTLSTHMDNRLTTFPKLLQGAGYQTAIFGKWHLGQGPEHWPTGFDEWRILPGQGKYHNPEFVDRDGEHTIEGYATDLITDMSLNWLNQRDANKPFCLLCHHKAPHRRWEPDAKHATMYENVDIPEPDTLYDDYANRAKAAEVAAMRIGVHMHNTDVKRDIPTDLDEHALRKWAYQYYIKDYLRCIASIDDNVGRILDYLDEHDLTENTIIIYTSDQGFFLGDHGWYDKRFMYEESLRMPFIIRYPKEIKPETVNKDISLNVDFAPTFLDYAGVEAPNEFQGQSMRNVLAGQTPDDWQQSMYYRYWMNGAGHNVAAHYGVRTLRYKLIYYYADGCGQAGAVDPVMDSCTDAGVIRATAQDLEPEWELFDLEKDPCEMNNVVNDPAYADVVKELKTELRRLQDKVGDKPFEKEG